MRRAWQIAAWTLLGLFLLVVVLGGALTAVANTSSGRSALERSIARLSRGKVLLQGLSGRFPDHLRLQALTLSDPHGPWLQAGELVLDWSPLQLLERRAHVGRLQAASVLISRRPAYEPHRGGGGGGGGGGVHLPVTVQIDQLDVPRLTLGAPLVGTAVALRIQGSGRFTSLQSASLQLSVARLDQVAATYRTQVQLSRQRMQVLLDLDEAAGGPLANLVRLPGLGALAVHLQLAGPRNALATRLDAQAGTVRAEATGTLDLPDRAATLDLSLQSAAMSPRPGLSWQRVSLQARMRGSLTAPATTAQLTLSGLHAGTVQLDSLQADAQGQGRALALDATLAGVSLPAPLHALLHAAPIRLHGQVQLARAAGTVLDLTLSHPLVRAQAHYQLGAGSGAATGSGTFSASIPQLAPWAALAHVDLRGSGTLQGQLSTLGAGAGAQWRLGLSGSLAVNGGQARWVALLAPHTDLSATATYDDKGLHLLRSRIDAAQLQASARGSDQRGNLDVSWQLTLPQLVALSPQASGRISAQGRLRGTMPHLTLAASADVVSAAPRTPLSIHLALQGRDLPQHPAGSIDLSGTLDHAPLRVRAALQPAADGALALQLQQAEWKSLQAGGALRMAATNLRAPQGQLSLRIARLADLDTVLGRPVQGSLEASAIFERPDGHSRARLTLDARAVGVPEQQLSIVQLRGEVDQPLLQPVLALQGSAQGTIRGAAVKLTMSANGPVSALQLHATAGATLAGAGASELQAQASWHGAQRELSLSALSASYRGQTLRLLSPVQVSLRNGVSVDRLRVGFGAAVIEAHGALTPRLNLRASVHNFTLAVLGALMPQFRDVRAQGHADATLQLQGSLQNPTGSLTLTAGGLGSGNGAAGGLPPGAIKVHAQLAAGAANLNVAVDAGTQMQLQASGELPLHRAVPMSLKMTGHMNLGLANPVLEAGGQRLLGQLAIQAEINGTLEDPRARGTLTLMHADLQDYARGVHIANINGTLQADGAQLRLTQLSAHAGTGTISASGGVDLGAAGMPVQLQLTAQHAQALKSDLLTADLDVNLRVSGALLPRRLAANGTVRINSATINIPNALPPDVPVLNVVRPGQQAPAPVRVRPLLADLNVTLNAPTGIFVRGRGLNAQVGGTLHATGSSSRLNIAGGFDLIRGTFDLAGATLNFSSGRISFNGTGLQHRIDPTLDFTATTYTGGVTATLNVGGYADAPVITLSSMPALPQDEILARLLFGESVSQLSALQIAGIGAALVTLTGVGGGGFNPLTKVQQALGLNRLVVSGGSSGSTGTTNSTGNPSQNTGATIEAGRYITNRVYIGAKQSTNGLSQAQVQVDLTRKWKLQTTLSTGGGTVQGATPENDPGSSIGMSYQFDY